MIAIENAENPRTERSITVERLSKSLWANMRIGIDRYARAKEAIDNLTAHIDVNASLPYACDVFGKIFDDWLTKSIREFEEEGQGIGNATIDRSQLDPQCIDLRRTVANPYSIGRDGGPSMEDALRDLMDTYDPGLLVDELMGAAATLEQRGLQEAADRIVDDFGMNAEYRMSVAPKRTARHWVFSSRLYADSLGYSFQCLAGICELAKALGVAASDSGIDGLAACAEHILAVLREARISTLASRTKIGFAPVEGVVFKEKLEWRMRPDVGDGLLAFMALHSTRPLRDPLGT